MGRGIYKRTTEQNRKISESLKGHHPSEESRKKMSISAKFSLNKGRFKKGHITSEESLKKIIEKSKNTQFKKGHIGYKGMLGKHHSEENKKRMSISHKGKKLSEEHIENLRLSHKGKHWKCSEEAKRNMSLSHRGKKLPEETKKKIGLSNKGKPSWIKGGHLSEETKRKLSIYNKGKIISEEQRRKISQTRIERIRSGELNPTKGMNLRPNKPETILLNLIKQNNLPFNYVGDGKIWFKGENHSFNPDFLSKNPKHIIEVYGEYHHNLLKVKERDNERIETYAKYGYKTLIIWSKELKDQEKVINKILEFIK